MYEIKQYEIIFNNKSYPYRFIYCDDDLMQSVSDNLKNTYYDTFEESLQRVKSYLPIFEIATGTSACSYPNGGHFGNTETMINEDKFYYVGTFYDTAENIINMTGKIYNSERTRYVDFTNRFENNLYDDNENLLDNVRCLFNPQQTFDNIGCGAKLISESYEMDIMIMYAETSQPGNKYFIKVDIQPQLKEKGVFYGLFEGITPEDYTDYDDPTDPYLYDSAKDSTDNQGTNDWTPDNITEKDLPTNFYGNSGLMKVFTPTIAELNAFSRYLWNDNFNIDQFKKIVNNPFDLILGFQYLPLKVVIGGTTPINVGNVLSVDTGLTMSYPTQENYRHSFGTLNLAHHEKKFLDYTPYCKMFIHLPYIGTQAIDPDLIRRASPVELIYKYNIVTGTIVAYLKGTLEGQSGILYEWVGNCNNTLPVANNDYSNAIGGMFSMISNAVGGAVFGGAIGGGVGASVGAISGAVSSLNVADTKPTITTQGSIGGMGACLNSSNDAFIITEQQRLSVATSRKGHKHLLGYPRNVSGQIKDSYGYNNIKAIRMSSDIATQEERQEITDILTQGYIYGDVSGDSRSVTPKPSKPTSNKVAFALYQNHSSNSRIDKSITHLHTYDCVFKDPTSIINPVIRIKGTDTNVLKGNYGYIPKFNRFYYVNNVTSINGDIWEISLHCDVLMSFRDDIIERNVLFNHSESNYNLYLNDGSLQMDSRPKITWDKFPSSLTNDGTYVLLLAGA